MAYSSRGFQHEAPFATLTLLYVSIASLLAHCIERLRDSQSEAIRNLLGVLALLYAAQAPILFKQQDAQYQMHHSNSEIKDGCDIEEVDVL